MRAAGEARLRYQLCLSTGGVFSKTGARRQDGISKFKINKNILPVRDVATPKKPYTILDAAFIDFGRKYGKAFDICIEVSRSGSFAQDHLEWVPQVTPRRQMNDVDH